MTHYNTLNVKLSDTQLINKSKSGIINGTEVILKLSSNVVGNSNNGSNLPHKLLLTVYTQVSQIPKSLTNGSSASIKF